MSSVSGLYEVSGDDVFLRVHVQPGAGKSAIVGKHGDAIKIRIAAPPVGGRANEAVRELLAKELSIASDAVQLKSGASSRLKRFRLVGVEEAAVERWLLSYVGTLPFDPPS